MERTKCHSLWNFTDEIEPCKSLNTIEIHLKLECEVMSTIYQRNFNKQRKNGKSLSRFTHAGVACRLNSSFTKNKQSNTNHFKNRHDLTVYYRDIHVKCTNEALKSRSNIEFITKVKESLLLLTPAKRWSSYFQVLLCCQGKTENSLQQ